MARALRVDVGDEVYHVINRANGRFKIFERDLIWQGVVAKSDDRAAQSCAHAPRALEAEGALDHRNINNMWTDPNTPDASRSSVDDAGT